MCLCPGYHFGVSEKSVVFNRNLNIFASTRLTCLPITIANILQSMRQFQKPIKKPLTHELKRFQSYEYLHACLSIFRIISSAQNRRHPLLFTSFSETFNLGYSHFNLSAVKFRSSPRRCSVRKVLLKISQSSQEKTPVSESLFLNINKVAGLRPQALVFFSSLAE